jgi:hypothetical protein
LVQMHRIVEAIENMSALERTVVFNGDASRSDILMRELTAQIGIIEGTISPVQAVQDMLGTNMLNLTFDVVSMDVNDVTASFSGPAIVTETANSFVNRFKSLRDAHEIGKPVPNLNAAITQAREAQQAVWLMPDFQKRSTFGSIGRAQEFIREVDSYIAARTPIEIQAASGRIYHLTQGVVDYTSTHFNELVASYERPEVVTGTVNTFMTQMRQFQTAILYRGARQFDAATIGDMRRLAATIKAMPQVQQRFIFGTTARARAFVTQVDTLEILAAQPDATIAAQHLIKDVFSIYLPAL